MLPDTNQRPGLDDDFADLLRGHSDFTERIHEIHGVRGIDSEEQPTGGLRVVEEIADLLRDATRERDAIADEFDIPLQPARQKSAAR